MIGDRTNSRQIVKNSTVISALNVLGFVTALIIDVIVAAQFGLQQETDAFFIAFAVPQFLMAVFLVAINVVLVPLFSQVIVEKGRAELWRLSSNLLNMTLVILALTSAIGSFGSPFWIQLLGAGLDEVTRQLATSLSRIIFFMVMPLGAIEVLKSVLNSQKMFAIPASTPFLRNAAVAIIAYFVIPIYGIYSLAVAYVVGTWLQLIYLLVALRFNGYQYHFIWQWRDVYITKAIKNLRHPLLGSSLIQSSMIFERFFVSFLPVGLVSALVFARRIMRAVDVVFTGSITTALLPDMSANMNLNKQKAHKKLLLLGIKLTLIISMPVVISVVGLREPLVQLLFQRGAFDQQATTTTAILLSIYILSIPFKGVLQMGIASFYAANDTKTPFQILTVMLVATLVLQAVLFFTMGAEGLAAAETVSRIVTLVYAVYILQKSVKIIQKPIVTFITKILVAAMAMLAGLGGIKFFIEGSLLSILEPGKIIIQIGFGGLFGLTVYISFLYILRVPEFHDTIALIRSRLNLNTVN